MITILKWRSITLGAGLLVAVLGSLVAIQRMPAYLVDRMLQGEAERNAVAWLSRILEGLDQGAASFANQGITANDALFLEGFISSSDAFRMTLVSAEGTTFWSSRPLGSSSAEQVLDERVPDGEIVITQGLQSVSEVDNFDFHNGHARQIYDRMIVDVSMPVIGPTGFMGAVNFNLDVTQARTSFISTVRNLLTVLFGGTLLTILGFSGTIARSVWQVEQRSETERTMMERQIQLTQEIKLLGELNEWLQSASSLDELFEMVSEFLSSMLPSCEGSIYVYSNSRDVLDCRAAWNDAATHEHIRPDECWGLRRGRTYFYAPGELGFTCEHTDGSDRDYMCFPILAHGETIGLMHMRADLGMSSESLQSVQRLSQMAAEQISLAIANVRMRDQLHEQSIRDPLTGLFNRRHMNESLRNNIQRAQKSGSHMSVLVVDVDHFKKFNDNHGHDAGDLVLRSVGSMLAKFCDGDEIACRMGGEEFVVLIPEQDIETAMLRAETIRKNIEEVRVRYADKTLPKITASFGIAQYPIHGTTPQELVRAADDALYEAKTLGRNRVVVASVFLGNSGETEERSSSEADLIDFFEDDLAEDTDQGENTRAAS